MTLREHFEPGLTPQADPESITALAEHIQQSFPENADFQERLSMARSQRPQHIMATLRFAVSGIMRSLVNDAEWRRSRSYVVVG